MFGFLNINKPTGPTSHDMVARVRRLLPRGAKIGHAGTLDPRADGVLVLCLGPAARLADYVQAFPKRYVVVLALGVTSTTDDSEGALTHTPGAAPPALDAIRQLLPAFVGDIDQVPPDFSAVHVDGRRAYKVARSGQQTNIQPRGVTVHSIDLLEYAWPLLTLDIACGSGTYIRSIARDIGQALGIGAYCRRLTRTQIGPFALADAVAPDAVNLAVHLQSPLLALPGTPRLSITAEEVLQIARGRPIVAPPSPSQTPDPLDVALLDPAGSLIALAKLHPRAGRILPSKVFVAE